MRRHCVTVAAWGALAACTASSSGPAPAEATAPPATVTIVARLPPTYAAGWLCPSVLAAGGVAYDATGLRLDRAVPNMATLARADLDGAGLGDLVVVRSRDGAVELHRGTSPCMFAPPVEIAPAAPGFARTVSVGADEVLVGVSEGDSPGRILRRYAGGWREMRIEARESFVRVGRIVWGVWRWQAHLFIGVDTGGGWIEPAVP